MQSADRVVTNGGLHPPYERALPSMTKALVGIQSVRGIKRLSEL